MLPLIDLGFIAGVGMLIVLAGATLWVLRRMKAEKHAVALFVAVLLLHALVASFVYFADFQPFSGGQGDYGTYHQTAERISYRFAQGNLEVGEEVRRATHYYPVVIGAVYTLFFPSMIIGQLFNAWLAALAMLFLYLIVRELGGSPRWALAVGLIGGLYPSFLFYTSLLLKDVVVILFVLAGLFLILRMLRQFTWQSFALLYVVLLVLANFRFYVGVILVGTFAVAWLLFSHLDWKKRLAYAAVMLPLIGFVPQIAAGVGYFGFGAISQYANEDQVTFYKEEVYNPPIVVQQPEKVSPPVEEQQPASETAPQIPEPVQEPVQQPQGKEEEREADVVPSETPQQVGYSSSVDLGISFENPVAFASTFLESFLFVLVGPYPTQFTAPRHYLVLLEMIPWYFLLFFIVRGVMRSFRQEPRAFTLLLFSVGLLSLLALFFSNFGITTRIRIPAFLALLPFLFLAFQRSERLGKEKARLPVLEFLKGNQRIQRAWRRISHLLFRTSTRRALDSRIKDVLRQYTRGRVLDIGAPGSRYREFITSERYEVLDITPGEHVDYVQDIHKTDFSDASFDTLVATQVLEHLYNPHQAIKEMHRILKPGGYVIASGPFLYNYHGEPNDYFRFTEYGLAYLFRDFREVTIIPFGGTFGGVVDLITTKSKWLKPLRIVNLLLDTQESKKRSKAPLGFVVIAKKGS